MANDTFEQDLVCATEAAVEHLLAAASVPGIASAIIRDAQLERTICCGVRDVGSPLARMFTLLCSALSRKPRRRFVRLARTLSLSLFPTSPRRSPTGRAPARSRLPSHIKRPTRQERANTARFSRPCSTPGTLFPPSIIRRSGCAAWISAAVSRICSHHRSAARAGATFRTAHTRRDPYARESARSHLAIAALYRAVRSDRASDGDASRRLR
jgi:hypothetical protein